MTRVQIPAYRNEWMKGDRYGNVVRTEKIVSRAFRPHKEYEMAYVLMDKSNKLLKVILADCEVI